MLREEIMAGCSPFEVAFTCDPALLYEKAIQKAAENGARVDGDQHAGEVYLKLPLMGALAVGYKIDGQCLTVTCKKRPMMVSCSLIETTVRSQLSRLDEKYLKSID